jgi:AcrR family transcriptional regulator
LIQEFKDMSPPTTKKQNHNHPTTKGMATRATLLDAAHDVFKSSGYYGASVSVITRRCGLSMGTFYRYFKNKEQVFQELNDLIISRFMDRAQALSIEGLSFRQRLKAVVGLLFDHSRDNLAFHSILGESELIDRLTVAYYEAIARYYRDVFRNEIQSGNMRPIDPNIIAYGLIGICYFHSLELPRDDPGEDRQRCLDLIVDFLLHGISGTAPWIKEPGWDILSIPDPVALHREEEGPVTKGEKTRQTIFRAAEKVIGEHGINRANISEITREAGVAQGTFYVHFESKHELIEGFVKYFNHRMRRETQRVVAAVTDRRDAERVGMLSFFEFVRRHRKIYRIVPECEIISHEVSLWYYNKIAQGYIEGLIRGIQKDEIRHLPPAFLARTLMGMTHFIALKWIIWSAAAQPVIPPQQLTDIVQLLYFGLEP